MTQFLFRYQNTNPSILCKPVEKKQNKPISIQQTLRGPGGVWGGVLWGRGAGVAAGTHRARSPELGQRPGLARALRPPDPAAVGSRAEVQPGAEVGTGTCSQPSTGTARLRWKGKRWGANAGPGQGQRVPGCHPQPRLLGAAIMHLLPYSHVTSAHYKGKYV